MVAHGWVQAEESVQGIAGGSAWSSHKKKKELSLLGRWLPWKKSLSSLRAPLCLCNPEELKFIPPESRKCPSPCDELKLDAGCKTQPQIWILLKFGGFNAGNLLPPTPEVKGLVVKPWCHSALFPKLRAAWAPGLRFRPLQLKVFK